MTAAVCSLCGPYTACRDCGANVCVMEPGWSECQCCTEDITGACCGARMRSLSEQPRAAVLLIEPQFSHNVGAALRACALFGAETLFWTGSAVPSPDKWPPGARLPREERMRCYAKTKMVHLSSTRPVDSATIPYGEIAGSPLVPV